MGRLCLAGEITYVKKVRLGWIEEQPCALRGRWQEIRAEQRSYAQT
jgi:hypothetical protein